MNSEHGDLDEILRELQLPPEGVKNWLEHLCAACLRHGGRRSYGGLLNLVERCKAALEETKDCSPMG